MDSTITIAFDGKRYFHNRRGLGNYSRDVIRLLKTYAPTWSLHIEDRPALRRMFGRYPTCDIYHGLSGEFPMHRTTCKRVVTIHDCIYRRYPHLYSATYRWLFDKKVAYACKHADLIICISEQTRADVMNYYHPQESKLRVVYQGCNAIFRQPVDDSAVVAAQAKYSLPEQYLLIVGAIEPRKNLENLIRAAAELQMPLPIVAVGGHSDYADRMAALAESLGVSLLLRHGVEFADFPAIYRGATLMVYPSFFEGFGIPILEAMCVGTPVLTSRGSCFAETGGEAAAYADPANPKDIAAHIDEILRSEPLREEMRQKGFEQAERFSDENVARNLIRVYNELM